jgi:hypothetical protein
MDRNYHFSTQLFSILIFVRVQILSNGQQHFCQAATTSEKFSPQEGSLFAANDQLIIFAHANLQQFSIVMMSSSSAIKQCALAFPKTTSIGGGAMIVRWVEIGQKQNANEFCFV